MSSENGHILFGYPITVDYWKNTPGEKYFRFLSHLHADHTVGLKSTYRGRIYTSHINKWLLTKWFNIDPDRVTGIDIGRSLLLANNDDSELPFSVTLIDANHCPGSVMFLFQGDFGNILYTGDFRYHPDMLTEYPMLQTAVESDTLISLYLDNTYAADHCEFPPKEELVESILGLIRSHPDHYIIIGLRKLGKEEIIRKIGLQLKETVCVSKERFELLTFLKFEQVFTTNPEDSRIFAVSMPEIERYKTNLQEQKGPVLIIILSAFFHQASKNSKFTNRKEYYFFPYSDHSSHSELEHFVSKLKPHSIHPIVSSEKVPTTTKASGYLDHLRNSHLVTSGCDSVIPQSILRYSRNSKKRDTFKATPNVFPNLQLKTDSRKCSIKESSKVSLNADNTNKINTIRNSLRKALIKGHNDSSMDSMLSDNTSVDDLFSSDETIKSDEMLCNKSNPDATFSVVNLLKGNESMSGGESDEDFYPLSQEEIKQQKSAEDCNNIVKEQSNTNCTKHIVNQISHIQSCDTECENSKGALEGQTSLYFDEHTNKMCYTISDDLSPMSSSITFNDNSCEKIRTPSKHIGMSKKDMDVDFESNKTHFNISQINSNLNENSGTDSEVSCSLLQPIDYKVSTDAFNKIYDIHLIPFSKKVDEVLKKDFDHAFKTWKDSIGRTNLTVKKRKVSLRRGNCVDNICILEDIKV